MNARSKVDTEDTEIETNTKKVLFNGAMVLWPPDCPHDMLDFAIERVKTFIIDFPVDTKGMEVRVDFLIKS